MSVEEAKQKVAELVTKYEALSPSAIKNFNEANTKQGFIEPLFRALGWNVDDTDEVTLEEKASNGRVDYAFKLHGVSQFYLEAKPLKADLTNPDYIKQAVTYAYNKGVTWVVLTDFEELRLFNAQSGKGWLSLNCAVYMSEFERLWLLSKDSLVSGLLIKEAKLNNALPSTLPVETRLFRQLRQWREDLFNQLYLWDKKLSFSQIDEIIQRLFDRLIFIRTCEDRGIEDKRLLAAVHQWKTGGHKGELVVSLRQIFSEFDGYYDSDLFAHHLTDSVFIMGTTLEEIITGLYEVPGGMASYDFSIIDADVLGAVYEQYLGHVASIVKQRAKEAQAKMDLGIQTQSITLTAKKERRKEQGIYYTPKFVTDYIVKETVGRFLKERSVNEIRNIKILDPACGSGSFLIRAFDELLKYYASQKVSKSESDIDAADRISILTSNIFGVDLDKQAVEIARLNLLLRSLAKRDLLPSLSDNIRQGNSLISGTEEELKKYFGDNWRDKRPFNWEQEFKDIMAQGGFDVVIGNPPYVNESRGHKDIFRELKELPRLQTYYEKNMDLFNYFIELGLDLLREGGFIGYIIPSYWQDRTGATLLRQKIIKESNIERLINLGEFKVFQEAPGQHNNVLILQKVPPSKKKYTLTLIEVESASLTDKEPTLAKPKDSRYALVNNKLVIGDSTLNMVEKLKKDKVFYLDTKDVVRGVDTSPSTYNGKGVFILSEAEYQALSRELSTKQMNEFFKPFYEAKHLERYYYEPGNQHWLIYTDSRRKELLESDKGTYRVIVNHLDNFKDIITSDNKPYGLHRPKNEKNFLDPNKLMFVRKSPRPKFVTVPIPYFVDEAVYLIIWHQPRYGLNYLLSIFNSKLADWWLGLQKKHGGQLQIDKEQVLSFPIRRIDFSNPAEKQMHDKLVALVDRMLELNKKLAPIRDTPFSERDELKEEIEKTDREIDNLVYELYGLTEEERQVIEASVSKS